MTVNVCGLPIPRQYQQLRCRILYYLYIVVNILFFRKSNERSLGILQKHLFVVKNEIS